FLPFHISLLNDDVPNAYLTAKIFDTMIEALGTSYYTILPELEHLLFCMFINALQPYLDRLDQWLRMGILDTVTKELFIEDRHDFEEWTSRFTIKPCLKLCAEMTLRSYP